MIPYERCPMCESDRTLVQIVKSIDLSEYLHQTCYKCGYQWVPIEFVPERYDMHNYDRTRLNRTLSLNLK